MWPNLCSIVQQAMQLDLSSLSSVHRFAEEWTRREQQLNMLINNAGALYMEGLFLSLMPFKGKKMLVHTTG